MGGRLCHAAGAARDLHPARVGDARVLAGIAALIDKLEALIASGHDSASLRFALAGHYLKAGDAPRAVAHAEVAVSLDPNYSAAWRLLGQAQVAAERPADAAQSFERGIAVAKAGGDRQVEKEMQVFLRRLRKADRRD